MAWMPQSGPWGIASRVPRSTVREGSTPIRTSEVAECFVGRVFPKRDKSIHEVRVWEWFTRCRALCGAARSIVIGERRADKRNARIRRKYPYNPRIKIGDWVTADAGCALIRPTPPKLDMALRSGVGYGIPGPWSGGPAMRAPRDGFTACPGMPYPTPDRTILNPPKPSTAHA